MHLPQNSTMRQNGRKRTFVLGNTKFLQIQTKLQFSLPLIQPSHPTPPSPLKIAGVVVGHHPEDLIEIASNLEDEQPPG